MPSKSNKSPSQLFVLVVILIIVQTLPTKQLVVRGGPMKELFRLFEPSNSYAVVELDGITKAVWDAGFKILSLILKNHISSIVPYNVYYNGYEWDYYKRHVIIYNNNTITIFAPSDKSFADNIEDWKTLEYQFVAAKVDREAFDSGSIKRGSHLLTCHQLCNVLVDGYGSINNVTITHWNIYNDGHIIVHGVQDFFHCKFGKVFKHVLINPDLDEEV